MVCELQLIGICGNRQIPLTSSANSTIDDYYTELAPASEAEPAGI
jgi:hypothetical protein